MLCEIDLETDLIDDLVCFLWSVVDAAWDGYDGDEVDKSGPALAIIYQAHLALLVGT